MNLKESLFKSTKYKTFEHEESLPPLPVPSLRSTLDCYLDSVRAVADDTQYRKTEEICLQFESGVGQTLQELLLKFAQNRKNWLTDYWLDFAYLMQRSPLIPNSNMTGVMPNFDFWPIKRGVRAERAALLGQYTLEFYQLLRKEQLKATRVRGSLWSMDQFRYLFNTCRIPGEEKDSIANDFRTESEGTFGSTTTIVLYRGYIFCYDQMIDGQYLTAPEIESQISYIENWVQNQSQDGPGVGALTTAPRAEWAQNREYLKNLSADNGKYLDIIEKAMSISAYEDKEPQNQSETCHEAKCGNCVDRWADKSLTNIMFINGQLAASADHTPYDALALAIYSQYINLSVFESKGQYFGPKQKRTLPVPTLLDFKIDDKLREDIEVAKQSYRESSDKIEFIHEVFKDYGRSVSAEHKIHPEAYIQIAIQLAYYRMHGKPASTYCTATTRRYYKGRTETCRSCTSESVEFAKAMVGANKTNIELYNLLLKAGQKFQQIMANACKGQGCDRHFLGLYAMTLENNIELPEIFIDPSFIDTGGSGTYVLSTSCAGYWKSCGGVPPMREDGYGCFYGIENHQYSFNIFTFKTCPETNGQLFYKNLCQSLNEMHKLLDSQKTDSTQLQHNI